MTSKCPHSPAYGQRRKSPSSSASVSGNSPHLRKQESSPKTATDIPLSQRYRHTLNISAQHYRHHRNAQPGNSPNTSGSRSSASTSTLCMACQNWTATRSTCMCVADGYGSMSNASSTSASQNHKAPRSVTTMNRQNARQSMRSGTTTNSCRPVENSSTYPPSRQRSTVHGDRSKQKPSDSRTVSSVL